MPAWPNIWFNAWLMCAKSHIQSVVHRSKSWLLAIPAKHWRPLPLRIVEQPLVLTAGSLLFGIFGLFFWPLIYLSGFGLVLGVHRSRILDKRSRLSRLLAYCSLTTVIFLTLHYGINKIKISAREEQQSLMAQLATKIALLGSSHDKAPASAPADNPRPVASMPPPAQPESLGREEIRMLDQIFAGKDESALRAMFGFDEMFALNVEMNVKKRLRYRETGMKFFDFGPYLEGRQAIFDIAASKTIHPRGGAIELSALEEIDAVPFVILSNLNVENKRILLGYENSSQLPSHVVARINEFDALLQKNLLLLGSVLDQAMKENPDYYLQYQNHDSSFFHEIDAKYWPRFGQLRPAVDLIRDAARRSLHIN